MSNNNLRAKYAMLSELFCMPSVRGNYWKSNSFDEHPSQVGDLVTISYMKAGEWYLSWLEHVIPASAEFNMTRYGLRSIETNRFQYWHNVQVDHYDRKRVAERPEWRWSDAQFAVADLWNATIREDEVLRSSGVEFHKDGSATFKARPYYGSLFSFRFNATQSNPLLLNSTHMKLMSHQATRQLESRYE